MKKLWNCIGIIILIFFCILICASHVANKFFQQDIGNVVLEEVNLDQQIDSLFHELESYLPDSERNVFETLKMEIKNNEEVKGIIGQASQQMLDDIVNNPSQKQDMEKVLENMIFSYDDEIEKITTPFLNEKQIHEYVKSTVSNLPIQVVYDTAVESFQETIPTTYLNIMKITNLIAKQSVWMVSMIASGMIALLLIAWNFKEMKWTFSIGMATLTSGFVLLCAGQIVPLMYQKMLQHLDHTLTQLTQSDFHLITAYGIGYCVIGIMCLIAYTVLSKRNRKRL